MLVFIDETGDTGFQFDKHSSPFFTIGTVVFNEYEEAANCDQRIQLLKKKLGLREGYEFYYKEDSGPIKESFFTAVSPYDFFYYGIVINKTLLSSEIFQIQESFYKYVCSLVFENAKEKLNHAIVIIDGSYSKDFEQNFQRYFKQKFNTNSEYKIQQVKMQDSRKNNLLQLADYIASGLNREYIGKKNSFLQIIKHREIHVQFLPKEKPTPIS